MWREYSKSVDEKEEEVDTAYRGSGIEIQDR